MLRINNHRQLNTHTLNAMQFNSEDQVQMDILKKILVVEDDPISQRVVQIALENMGYQVDIAGNGSKALALFKSTDYSLVLMDYGLPDMTGIAVTSQIREFEEAKNKHTPIIALTAQGDFAKAECLAAGMDDFVAKPFELIQLKQLLRNWVKKLK